MRERVSCGFDEALRVDFTHNIIGSRLGKNCFKRNEKLNRMEVDPCDCDSHGQPSVFCMFCLFLLNFMEPLAHKLCHCVIIYALLCCFKPYDFSSSVGHTRRKVENVLATFYLESK